MFLKISQTSQENTCARVSFLQAAPATLLKKRLWLRSFPVNFAKFLRTPFLQTTSGRLLLTGIYHKVDVVILFVTKEETCSYSKQLIQNRFNHAVLIGPWNENIRNELPTLKSNSLSDEELLENLRF